MNILAIDTATEQCSVAVIRENLICSRAVQTPRAHAELILPMVDEVLRECSLSLASLDGLAFGRGPGSFTGVRIATSVAQGLSLAAGLPVVGISNLAAVAQQVAQVKSSASGVQILVCMDARMNEVYWALYSVGAGRVSLVGDENVTAPDRVDAKVGPNSYGAGTGWRAYPVLRTNYPSLSVKEEVLPRAVEIAQLAIPEFEAGRGGRAEDAQPVYLRDQVVVASRP